MNKKTTFTVLGIVALVALVAIGILLKKPAIAPVEEPTIPAQTETGIEAEIGTSTQPCETCAGGAAEISTGTLAETPAETSPTETSGLSSCVILDEEYCKNGEEVYYNGSFAPEFKGKLIGMGFYLSKGTKIYAPFDGLLGFGTMGTSEVVFVDSPPFETATRIFVRDVEANSALMQKATKRGELGMRVEVKKGDYIAIASGEVVDITDYNSDKKYAVLIEGLKGNASDMSSFLPDSSILSQYFKK